MGIDDSYLSFCFDEACEFILKMQTTKIVVKDGKQYEEETWIKQPNWSDKPIEKPKNNMELIKQMKNNLDNMKQRGDIYGTRCR